MPPTGADPYMVTRWSTVDEMYTYSFSGLTDNFKDAPILSGAVSIGKAVAIARLALSQERSG